MAVRRGAARPPFLPAAMQSPSEDTAAAYPPGPLAEGGGMRREPDQ
jgi:hypothetical protein